MASFTAQLKDMFFVLVERITGYGRAAEDKHDAAGAQEPSAAETTRTEEVVAVKPVEIRARGDPVVPDGSHPQVA
ncbi:hypothetical protein BAE44_0022148 [Dichanthelium oligosanthes]|uniref:Uncharacterized protein n=1 Tax=Dichanthelium oligosanthes TaxID=888268 RepID=A0A1E5UVF1_9POAL|nr:hypothetical protein BAE44_0022148 [Dichanthelium oligosanthes]